MFIVITSSICYCYYLLSVWELKKMVAGGWLLLSIPSLFYVLKYLFSIFGCWLLLVCVQLTLSSSTLLLLKWAFSFHLSNSLCIYVPSIALPYLSATST